MCVGLTTLFAQNIPSYVPKNGLVGWWPFNGNANDESGNGNNGVVNGATLTTDRNGTLNSAYSFDGVSNIKIVNSNSIQNIKSVSFWFISLKEKEPLIRIALKLIYYMQELSSLTYIKFWFLLLRTKFFLGFSFFLSVKTNLLRRVRRAFCLCHCFNFIFVITLLFGTRQI